MSDSWMPVLHETQRTTEPCPEAGAMFQIVTWNIQFGIETQAAAEAHGVHPELAAADVVLLQEMDRTGNDPLGAHV